MNTSLPPRNPSDLPDDIVRQEASIWLDRLVGADVTQVDVDAFRRWRSTSHAHAVAFDDAKLERQEMRYAIGEVLRTDSEVAAQLQRLRGLAAGSPMFGRRAFLCAAGSAAVATGVALVYPPLGLWPSFGALAADYRTATGEQLDIEVSKNISVALNTQTSVRRERREGNTTGLTLIAGEMAVDFALSRTPFSVRAGAGLSVAESGRFEVRNLDGRVRVTCLDGAVRVRHPLGERRLEAREQTVYRDNAIGGIAGIETAAVSAWRRGVLEFRETPLVKVIEEINRYRPGRVVLVGNSHLNAPISGHFSIAALNEALIQIERTFGFNTRSLPGGLLILS